MRSHHVRARFICSIINLFIAAFSSRNAADSRRQRISGAGIGVHIVVANGDAFLHSSNSISCQAWGTLSLCGCGKFGNMQRLEHRTSTQNIRQTQTQQWRLDLQYIEYFVQKRTQRLPVEAKCDGKMQHFLCGRQKWYLPFSFPDSVLPHFLVRKLLPLSRTSAVI